MMIKTKVSNPHSNLPLLPQISLKKNKNLPKRPKNHKK